MLGLNPDYPLLLSTVIEHAAATFGDTEIVSHGRMEKLRSDYRSAAMRSRRLGRLRRIFSGGTAGAEYPTATSGRSSL